MENSKEFDLTEDVKVGDENVGKPSKFKKNPTRIIILTDLNQYRLR